MPKSMRAQSAAIKRRKEQISTTIKNRTRAVALLREGTNIRSVAKTCNLSVSTAYRLKKEMENNDSDGLQKMLSAENIGGGRRRVFSDEEEKLITSRLVEAAKNGSVADDETLRDIMKGIAADGRATTFKGGTPSYDAIRSFKARNRDCAKAMKMASDAERRKAQKQKEDDRLQKAREKWEKKAEKEEKI